MPVRAPYTPDMRIYMQTRPAPGEAPRYVQLVLEQDLLGAWTLYRESGTQGGRATLRKEVFLDRDAALDAFEKARSRQTQRGYQVMITQGLDSPHGR